MMVVVVVVVGAGGGGGDWLRSIWKMKNTLFWRKVHVKTTNFKQIEFFGTTKNKII